MAAKISKEHHLGMTCDPIGGLIQIPCIERNTMGAIKAITASQLALHSDPGNAKVSLDAVVKTMCDTAKDMNSKYKETSDGGLAINIPISLSECCQEISLRLVECQQFILFKCSGNCFGYNSCSYSGLTYDRP